MILLFLHRRAAWFLFALAAAPTSALAQSYYDVLLTPTGYTNAAGLGISGVAEVGAAVNSGSGYTTALLWPTSTSSAINLGPSGWTFSQANGVSGNQQVGEGIYPNNDDTLATHALLWTGTAGSMVDLNPSGFTYSIASATDGRSRLAPASKAAATPAMRCSGPAPPPVPSISIRPITPHRLPPASPVVSRSVTATAHRRAITSTPWSGKALPPAPSTSRREDTPMPKRRAYREIRSSGMRTTTRGEPALAIVCGTSRTPSSGTPPPTRTLI